MSEDRAQRGSHLRIVRGNPDPEELAALLAVVAARAAPPSEPAEPAAARSAWADPVRRLRSMPATGPGAWRRSATPR
jgi:hypothetical protein